MIDAPTRKTLIESFITIVLKKAIMLTNALNFQRQKTSLGLDKLLVDNYGQHESFDIFQICPLYQLSDFVLKRYCKFHVSLNKLK